MIAPAPLTEEIESEQAPRRRKRRWHPSLVIGVGILVLAALAAIFADFAPYPSEGIDLLNKLSPPNSAHLLGTDRLGRDVLSSLLYGSRVSLSVSALAILIGGSFGLAVGALAGYIGGRLDAFIMRVTDIVLGFPLLVLGIFFAAVYGPSFNNVVLVIAVILWAPFARLARGETLVLKEREFVAAAIAEGAPALFIVRRHILPHLLSSAMVLASLQGAAAILIEAALSFFGAGVPPGTASWGGMINDGREYALTAWWIAFFPGVALSLVVLGLNLIGDTLRDILDPRASGA